MLEVRLVAVVIGLLGPPGPAAEAPSRAVVVAEVLDVFDGPDDRSVASGQLRRGDRVVVREAGPEGWLAIEPPPGSFLWVERSSLRALAGGRDARVESAQAAIRSGIPEARMPGPPRGALTRGAVVRLVDRPPLVLGTRTWVAIAPTAGEVRYVRAEGLGSEEVDTPEPPRETRAAFLREETTPRPPAAIAAEVARIEAAHRAALREPIEHWRLETVRHRYEALLKQATDAASGNAIRARLDRVARHEAAAEAARTIEAILAKSRTRDRKLALYLRRLAEAQQPQERPYDAEGLIQPSSRKVDGQKVFALIGPEGTTLAYLDIPPGLDTSHLMARRVGVRGQAHYDENLRARLITVRDLEPLDELR